MLAPFLQDRAALYASGAMTAPERQSFELVLEFHGETQAWVGALQEAMAVAATARLPRGAGPSPGLRSRILESLPPASARPQPVAMVVTDAKGLTEWINPAFTAMCGYTLDELRGRKPGHVLQGPETDRAVVSRIRAALQAGRPCRETVTNYHKSGARYVAEVSITPILDDEEQPVWFAARERILVPA